MPVWFWLVQVRISGIMYWQGTPENYIRGRNNPEKEPAFYRQCAFPKGYGIHHKRTILLSQRYKIT